MFAWAGSCSGVSMFFGTAAIPCMLNVIFSERLPEPEKAESLEDIGRVLVKQGEDCVVKELEGWQPGGGIYTSAQHLSHVTVIKKMGKTTPAAGSFTAVVHV